MWGPGRTTHPAGGKAGKRLRSCAVLAGVESAGAPRRGGLSCACAPHWRVSGAASFSRRGRRPQPPLLVGSVVMEPLDELDLLMLEEDGGAEDVPRAEL